MAQSGLYQPGSAGAAGGPFGDLRREMDALFDRFFAPASREAWRGVFPAVNLYETAGHYVLTAEIPGVDAADVQVTVEGSTLSLRGERKLDYLAGGDANIHRQERQAGSFRRAFELPAPIEADKVEAVVRNGVLMLRLPKAPEHRPRQISVQAG